MKIIEICNDMKFVGAGIFTIETDFAVRSLIGFFWDKEERRLEAYVIFIRFIIR